MSTLTEMMNKFLPGRQVIANRPYQLYAQEMTAQGQKPLPPAAWLQMQQQQAAQQAVQQQPPVAPPQAPPANPQNPAGIQF